MEQSDTVEARKTLKQFVNAAEKHDFLLFFTMKKGIYCPLICSFVCFGSEHICSVL